MTGSIPTAHRHPDGRAGRRDGRVPERHTGQFDRGGFISVRPANATGLPTTSNVNFTTGAINPNAVLVELPVGGGDDGKIEITFDVFGAAGPTTEVLVDVVGYTTDTRLKAIETAVAAARTETITAGGASGAFVFPAAQLTLGTATITTTKSGHLELKFVGSGGTQCVTTTVYDGWIEVDGVPVRSSRVTIGESFDVAGADTFSATNFSQKVLSGVTATPVPAGVDEVRARFACTSGNAQLQSRPPTSRGSPRS